MFSDTTIVKEYEVFGSLSENDADARKYSSLRLEQTFFRKCQKLQMENTVVIKLPRMLMPISLATALLNATPQAASAYQIDCAILLCLAGGFPASAPCIAARATMIRRITPWPIEPPLQIWRCPMRASFRPNERLLDRFFEVALSADSPVPLASAAVLSPDLMRIQDSADVDISDPAFDFVRSIRVFEITFQQHRNHDGDCNSWGAIFMGSYGEQGDYTRRRSSPSAVPEASDFAIPSSCSSYWHRSVFVEWRDYEGIYGHEEVHY